METRRAKMPLSCSSPEHGLRADGRFGRLAAELVPPVNYWCVTPYTLLAVSMKIVAATSAPAQTAAVRWTASARATAMSCLVSRLATKVPDVGNHHKFHIPYRV